MPCPIRHGEARTTRLASNNRQKHTLDRHVSGKKRSSRSIRSSRPNGADSTRKIKNPSGVFMSHWIASHHRFSEAVITGQGARKARQLRSDQQTGISSLGRISGSRSYSSEKEHSRLASPEKGSPTGGFGRGLRTQSIAVKVRLCSGCNITGRRPSVQNCECERRRKEARSEECRIRAKRREEQTRCWADITGDVAQ